MISNPQPFNRNAYVQNDPVNFVDPTGLDPCTDENGNPIDCGPPNDPEDIVRVNTYAPYLFGPYFLYQPLSVAAQISLSL